MSKLTLRDYLSANRTPSKIICIDAKTTYHQIPISQVYVPVVSSMIVDHVEIDPECLFSDVVFVRAPEGMKVG